jgi:hypothetical protein
VNINCSFKRQNVFGGLKETEYLGFIVGNETLRKTPEFFLAVRDRPLPKKLKSRLNLLSSSVLTMESSFTISQIVLRY